MSVHVKGVSEHDSVGTLQGNDVLLLSRINLEDILPILLVGNELQSELLGDILFVTIREGFHRIGHAVNQAIHVVGRTRGRTHKRKKQQNSKHSFSLHNSPFGMNQPIRFVRFVAAVLA